LKLCAGVAARGCIASRTRSNPIPFSEMLRTDGHVTHADLEPTSCAPARRSSPTDPGPLAPESGHKASEARRPRARSTRHRGTHQIDESRPYRGFATRLDDDDHRFGVHLTATGA